MYDLLKQYIDRVLEIYDSLDENGMGIGNIVEGEENATSIEILKADVVMFLLYLAASDGELSEKEAGFIGSYLGIYYTVDKMREEIRDNNIYSTDFEQRIPLSVVLMVQADNKIVQNGYIDSTGSRMIYDFFKLVGQAFLACDNSIGNIELDNLARYLNNIKMYINENALTTSIIYSNPTVDAEESKKLVVIYESGKYETRISKMKQQSELKDGPAPWDTVYYRYVCPYCGKYKVRDAKWEDKQFSVAFWGIYSYKLHSKYKCDSCRSMWN